MFGLQYPSPLCLSFVCPLFPQEAGITELLTAPGKLPGCSGTRNLSDNLSDLRAQVRLAMS